MTKSQTLKSSPVRFASLLLAGTALAALSQPAQAQEVWDGSESSDWGEDGNWSTGILPPFNASVSINNGTVTTQPVIAAGDVFNARVVNVGAPDGTAPVLTVNGVLGLGDGPNGGSLNIASAASDLTGTVVISGADARIGPSAGATAGVSVRVGTTLGSNGTLRIEDGGTGSFLSVQIANGLPSAAGVGLVEVIGAGSLLEITSGAAGLSIGNINEGGGVGTVRVLDGAAFTTPGGVGSVVGPGSSILVSGADAAGNGSRFIVPTQLQVRGGNFTVEDGGEAQVTGLLIEGDAALRVLDGGTLSSVGGAIGSRSFLESDATAIISGAGSRWTSTSTNGVLAIGNSADGVGTLEVLNGGEVDFNSTLTLASGSSLRVAGTDTAGVNARFSVEAATTLEGEILIEDGGIASFRSLGLNNPAGLTVTAGGLAVVETTSTFSVAQQAQVRISGAGAEMRSTGGLSLLNGSAGQPSADFIIEDGARLELNGTVGAGVTFGSGNSERRNLIVRDGSELEIINPGFGFLGNNGGLIIENGSRVITQGSWDVKGTSELTITGGSRLELNGAQNPTFSPETDILLSGEGSALDIAANISLGGGNPGGGTVVITDGATLRARGPSDNGLGFNGVLRTVEITNGGSWIMTGGPNAGLQIETTDLLVDGGTLSAEGVISIGLRFTGTNLTLIDSDFSARQLTMNMVAGNTVNIGGTRTSAAGAAGLFDVDLVALGAGNLLVLNHSEQAFDIDAQFAGPAGARIEHLAGDTTFSGTGNNSTYGGELAIRGGSVRVNGTLGGIGMQTNVSGGARLSGTGTIGGTVTIADATIAAGNSPGTLAINGDLLLSAASILEFELGDPAGIAGVDSDLITVTGDLTLDGNLNIIDAGVFGAGLYRLISFGGDITDNTLEFGSIPGGFSISDLSIQITSSNDGDVNLVFSAPANPLNFWDGANVTANGTVDGGTGTWTVIGTNWTAETGTPNSFYDPAQMLIFMGTGGIVTLDDSAGAIISQGGLQFAVDGYTLTGSDLVLDANRGVIRVGDGTSAGADFTATIASAITGDQALEKTDLGTLRLTGANSYSGGTIITHGTLSGDTASLQGAIANNGTLLFDQSAAGTFAGIISGTGSLAKQGAGRLALTGANSYSGGTIVSDGTLAGNAISLQGDIVANATLEFAQSVAGTFAGDISGTGALIKTGNGTLTLTGANSYSGGTSVNAGGLRGSSTSLQGEISLTSAELLFDQDLAGTYSGRVSGSGALTKTGTGALTLTGASDFGGSIIVEEGEIIAGLANLPTTASLTIEDIATLRLVQDADAVFAQAIDGGGRFIKEGSAVLTLTAMSPGEFGFTGITDLNAGSLVLNGDALGGEVNAALGTQLSGTGSTGTVNLASGATIAAGNSIGTLTTTGVSFASGSRYIVELNDGGTVTGVNNDLIASGGTVTIDGGTVTVRPANGTDNGSTYAAGSIYTIISATGSGSVTGAFDGVEDDFAFLDFTLSYDPANVFLTSQLVVSSFCVAGLTSNQCSTGEGAFSLGGGIVFDALLQLSAAEVPQALDQLSGEVHASLGTAFVEDSRFPREAALVRLSTVAAGAGAWVKGFGSWGNWDADGNTARLDRDIVGAFFGADAALGESARIGVFGGYSHSDFDIEDRSSSASADSYHLGVYGGGRWAGFGLSLGGAIAWHDASTARAVAFSGFSDSAQSRYDGRTSQLFGEVSYRLGDESDHIEPFANFALVDYEGDALIETGGPAALLVDERGGDNTFTTLGLRAQGGTGTSANGLTLRGSVGWRRAFGDRAVQSVHSLTGGDKFTVAGVAVARNAAAIEAGLDWAVSERAAIGFDYTGMLGSTVSDHGVQARLSVRF
ncbi:autotransporter domain-containing protein [Qipengyuania sp. ASV99]|uniref:autotransporter domain-containing protein n=1 Tax=Qipengyuania sp. ASV99 TaxID=3399681 RepID=UPI003A4C74D1